MLEDVSLTVPDGAVVCLIAPPAAGRPHSCAVSPGWRCRTSGTVTGVPERLGFVFQEGPSVPAAGRRGERCVWSRVGMSRPDIEAHLRSWDWRTAWISGRRNCPADSGGGCPLPGQYVMVELLLLDEPFKVLDGAALGAGQRSIFCGTGTARRCCASPTTGRTRAAALGARSWKYERDGGCRLFFI